MKKDELLTRIEESRTELEEIIGRLSDAKLEDAGGSFWPAKIHLAHLAAWEAGVAALLQQQPRYAGMRLDEATFLQGETAINAAIYEQNRDKPVAEIVSFFYESHRQMMVALASLTDADLQKTYSFYQPDEPGEDSGAPIIGWVIADTFEHYEEHLPYLAGLAEM
jgi:hypothetical protein